MPTPRRLINIGCGRQPHTPDDPVWTEGVTNLDMAALPGVTVVHDLDRMPWPFPDGHFGAVEAMDVLEHLVDLPGAMAEIARILAPGGQLVARVPLWGSLNHACDPTHRRGFTEQSFDYFDPELPLGQDMGHYSRARFRVDEVLFEGGAGTEAVRVARRDLPGGFFPPAMLMPYTVGRQPGANFTFFLTRRA